MSALTREVKDPNSPVAAWLRRTFPHHKETQAAYRTAVGPARVLPSPAVATGTQGAAIDWWLRMLVDPAPSVDLALAGLRSRRAPCIRAGAELLLGLGAIDREWNVLGPIDPARFADRSDEWWARVCYALALLVELYRSPMVDGSRLMRLRRDSPEEDLLALANEDEVADLIAMRDLALAQLLPALPPGPVSTGMTFDGSADLNADADLIAGGVLVDFKAGQGGKPRADGTRAAVLARTEIDQLLGYALMDYSDAFALHAVAIYAIRFGHFAAWPITDLCAQLAGHSVDLPVLRRGFAEVLRVELPAYEAASMAAWARRARSTA
jgi:hypothetical protein